MQTLLLPGMDGTGRLFASFQSCLPPELNPRIIKYSSEQPCSYDQLLENISVPSGPFAVVAESFSGPLGVRLATRYPDRLRALVLVASFVRSPSILAGWMHTIFGSQMFRMRLPDIALRYGLLGMDATDDEVDDLRDVLQSVKPSVLAGRLGEIITVDVRNGFTEIKVPILLVAGKRDRLVGSKVITQMKLLRPDVEIRVLDAPHMVLQRRPEEAGKLISEFLLKHE